MTPKKSARTIDLPLLLVVLALLAFGLAVVYSASTVQSYAKTGGHSTAYYLIHQLLYGGLVGSVLMYVFSKIDYHVWQKWTPLIIMASIGLLFAVLLPHVGISVGNSGDAGVVQSARRWISFGPLFMQPSEIVKLALIFYIASWIDKRSHEVKDFYYGMLPSLAIIVIVAVLILKEPDVGTMLVVIITALVMLFVGGSQIKHLAWIMAAGLAGFAVLVKLEPYRVARFTAFLNPSVDPKGIGYQMNQALVAIGSGGLFGYGYGNSRQKHNFLPEASGDSVFAVIVEELGFAGAAVLVFLYLWFAQRGMKIAKGAPDTFGKMVSIGIVTWIIVQAMINIGAIIGLLPLTGIPLPFVSYGSSALVVTLAAMGVLLNISKHSNIA